MASGMTERRPSPVGGREMEPDEKEQRNLRFHLEAFQPYIIRCVVWQDLLMYGLFSAEKMTELRSVCKRASIDECPEDLILEQILANPERKADIYTKLLHQLEVDGNEKVVKVLKGEVVPTGDSRQKDHFFRFCKRICDRLLPMDILPSLLSKEIISTKDAEQVTAVNQTKGATSAAFELMFILPQKRTRWYQETLEALLDSSPGHKELAMLIDQPMCEEIIRCQEAGTQVPEDFCVSLAPVDSEEAPASPNREMLARESSEVQVSYTGGDTMEHVMTDAGDPSLDLMARPPKGDNQTDTMLTGIPSSSPMKSCDASTSLVSLPSFNVLNSNVGFAGTSGGSAGTSGDSAGNSGGSAGTSGGSAGTSGGSAGTSGDSAGTSGGSAGTSSGAYSNVQQTQCKNNLSPDKVAPDTTPGRREDAKTNLCFDALLENTDNTAENGCPPSPAVNNDMVGAVNNDMVGAGLDFTSLLSEGEGNTQAKGESRVGDGAVDIKVNTNCRDPDETCLKQVIAAVGDLSMGRSGEGGHTGKLENFSSHVPKEMKDKHVAMTEPAIPGVGLNISNSEESTESAATQPKEPEVKDEDITLRKYQTELAEAPMKGKNVIIVAPTGSGKTHVALRIIQDHMRQQRGRGIAKVIFIVEQVALAVQQGEACTKVLRAYRNKVISGESQRAKNECLKDFVDKRDILVVTAQVLLDALVKKEISSVNTFSLIIFDECHHTHANHPYNQIMSMYVDLKFSSQRPVLPQIVGLTASVGVGKSKNVEKAMDHIKRLMANLDSEDICTVKDHMDELRTYVSLPEEETCTVPKRRKDVFGEGITKLMNAIEQRMSSSSLVLEMADSEKGKFVPALKSPAQKGSPQYTQWVSKLWKETAKLRGQEVRRFLNPCRAHLEYYNTALIIYNDARMEDAMSYLDGEMKKWKDSAIMDDNEKRLESAFDDLMKHMRNNSGSENPKLEKLREMITRAYEGDKWANSRGIVFVKTRDLAKAIVGWMSDTPGLRELRPIPFLGQSAAADRGGMTKAEQDDALQYFKDGKHKLIVATSVAEEGLDISKCNLVIRYDHVTNEIAMVQSRGRGRAQDSKYYVLAEEGTGMAEKEELNMIREVMMRKAIIQLQAYIRDQPKKFKKDLHKLQDEANLERQLKSLGQKRRIIHTGEFELRCLKCSEFICMSSDVKKIENAHHVVVDESIKDRVKFIDSSSSKLVDKLQMAGKLICKNCGEHLGVVSIYRSLELPVLKIEKFLIIDENGRQDNCKYWKKVPFRVSALDSDDIREIVQARQ